MSANKVRNIGNAEAEKIQLDFDFNIMTIQENRKLKGL